jgi:hypothetical protein
MPTNFARLHTIAARPPPGRRQGWWGRAELATAETVSPVKAPFTERQVNLR